LPMWILKVFILGVNISVKQTTWCCTGCWEQRLFKWR